MSLLLSFIIPSVTLHFGRLALICDLFHIKPLPPSHSLYILVYFFLSHVLSIVASYSLDSRSHPSWSLRHSTAYKIFFCFFSFKHAFFFPYLSLLLSHATSFQTPFFSFSVLLYFSCLLLLPPLFSSSLLINIWIWVHWHDTTVPCWSWGCLDLAAEDEEGNTQHFQTYIWAFFFVVFCHKILSYSSRTANHRHFCSYYVKMSEVAERSCKYKHLSNKDFRIFGENIGRCSLCSDVFQKLLSNCVGCVKLATIISICNVFWVVSSADVNRHSALNLSGKTGILNDQSNLNPAAVNTRHTLFFVCLHNAWDLARKAVDVLSTFAGANTSGGKTGKRDKRAHVTVQNKGDKSGKHKKKQSAIHRRLQRALTSG